MNLPPNKALQRTRASVACLPWLFVRVVELARWASIGFCRRDSTTKFSIVCTLVCSSFVTFAVSATEPLRGEKLFLKHCASCHSFGCNKIAPKLEGVFGRRAGSLIDYKNYSAAMKASEVIWSEETIDAFIYDPNGVVPGTPMAAVVFIENAEDRRDIISYLLRQDERNDSCL